jgi:hypothetical protein
MTERLLPVLRGAAVTLLVWLPCALVAWLVLHALDESGSVSLSDDVTALRVGVFAFVSFVAAVLGAIVAGRALRDAGADAGAGMVVLAASAPLLAMVAEWAAHHLADAAQRNQVISLGAASLLGGVAGAYLSAGRADDAVTDRAWGAQASSARAEGSRGWRS